MARVVYTEELIRRFHQRIILKYPDLPLSTVDKIVRAEFRMMKDVMVSGSLEDFRLQYLFNIKVSPQKILKQLRLMYNHKDKISSEKYDYYMEKILKHIQKKHLNFNKYEHRIRKYTGYSIKQISRGEYTNNGHQCHT